MDRRGITFIELAVVVSITAVLCVLCIPAVGTWKQRYDVETTIKEMYNALNEARMTAFSQKRLCGLVWTGNPLNQVTLRCDTDNDEDLSDESDIWQKSLKVSLNENLSGSMCTFSIKGFANTSGSFRYNGTDADPEYTCVVVDKIRIKMGKWDGSKCVVR